MKVWRVISVLTMVLLAAQLTFSQGREGSLLAMDKPEPLHISLYPNPSTDFLNVRFESASARKIKVSVQNIIGNIMEVETEVLDDHELQLKVRDLPTGFYLLSVKDPETNVRSTYKFLKR